jgi:pimeloyl-ACP methyl ester carboxylesterase
MSASKERPIILVNGMGSNFDAQFGRTGLLDKLKAAGRTVIGVDLPGHGASRDAVGTDAADLVLNEASKHDSVDAIGFSAGAWAILLAASEKPELFNRVAVMGAADMVVMNSLASDAMLKPVAEGLVADGASSANPMIVMLSNIIEDAGSDPEGVAGYLASEKRFVTVEGLGDIKAKAFVVDGSGDMTGPSKIVAESIPGAERMTLDDADHFDIPASEEALAAVVSFIDAD